MAEQLTFDLPSKTALGREAFFVSGSNARAVKRLENWQNWPSHRLILIGPEGSGKTHLAHIWALENRATMFEATELASVGASLAAPESLHVIENADRVVGSGGQQEALFHAYNEMAAQKGTFLITARSAPALWPIDLADLKSRMMSMDVVTLDPPDDALLSMMLVKLFRDRQISVDPELIPFLVTRMERSARAAQKLVDALDKAALQQKRPVTKRLAATIL